MSEVPEKSETLLMFRPTLNDLPPLILPPGVKVRHMRPDEGTVWDGIVRAAFQDANMSFEEMMRADTACTPERVLFAEENGTPVATASAWRKAEYGPHCGYLHWVGALPERTGKGFGHIVSLAAMYRMREEGCVSAVLHTQDFRLPAIKTYLRLGFHICIDHPTLPTRWAAISEKIAAQKT